MDVLLSPVPATDSDVVDLHAFYAQDWLVPGGVRVNFVASVDGGITAAGLSKGLQTPGDNRVFAVLRDLADVVMVGASTATAENYGPVRLSDERQAIRRALGLLPNPAIAVVSGSLDIDLSAPLYREASPESPVIVITGPHAPVDMRNDIIDLASSAAAVQLVEVAAAGSGVSFAGAVARLRELEYTRILCEGGPRLFTAGLAERSVTELCLSVSPMLLPGAAARIVHDEHWPEGNVPKLTLLGLLAEDSALFCRYAVDDALTA
jgi:riboflavin biosynthesis pyrimidine reductase